MYKYNNMYNIVIKAVIKKKKRYKLWLIAQPTNILYSRHPTPKIWYYNRMRNVKTMRRRRNVI